MAAAIRPPVTRLLATLHRLTAQQSCLMRPLCRLPPDHPGEAKDEGAAADQKNEATGKLSKSREAENNDIEHFAEVKTDLKPSGTSSNNTIHDKAAEAKKYEAVDSKTSSQKKLHDLLSSLATADPIPAEPRVQLSHPKPKKKGKRGEPKTQPSEPELKLDPELVTAAKEVAKSLEGDAEVTESELLSTLRLHTSETAAQSSPSLSELFVGMKVERKPQGSNESVPRSAPRGWDQKQPSQTSQDWDNAHPRKTQTRSRAPIAQRALVDLFGAEPLGIFSKETTPSEAPSQPPLLPTWERLQAHELQQMVAHPPSNAFVEMIQWTNDGKLWTFPIDNEIGLEEEKKVGFQEHVFLERHLEGWCPRRGPIRHFMELVCTGLSKNPYLTVQRKKAHIEWYKNYFAGKEELLKELGAIESTQ